MQISSGYLVLARLACVVPHLPPKSLYIHVCIIIMCAICYWRLQNCSLRVNVCGLVCVYMHVANTHAQALN